jgi:hypothetical protein
LTNITNKPTLVSGSSQIDITGTTGYSTFSSSIDTSIGGLSSSVATTTSNLSSSIGSVSSSISSSIGSLSSSVATTTDNIEDRVGNLEVSTGSLNSFTSSINTTIKTKLNTEGVISGSVQVTISDTTGYSTFSSSISSSINDIIVNNLGQDDRLDLLETSSGSLNSFTSSINTTIKTKLNTEGVVSGSSQIILSGTTGFSVVSASLSSLSSSISITNFNQDGRLNLIETSTGSLNTFTSSIDTTIKSKLNTEGVISGSGQVNVTETTGYSTFSSSISSSIGSLSGSIATTDSNQNGRLNSLETTTGSVLTRVSLIETSTGSLNSFTSSINTTIKTKLNTENVVSGSSQIDITSTTGYPTFSSSIATTDSNQNDRLNSIENKTGSYATTGSNVFVGTQTISGSVIIRENLTVLGSSSITYTTSSQLRVDDNVITVNTSNPAERFGGLQVYDSGSVGEATGSLLWDSQKNRWVYQQSSESTYGGGVLMSGPRSSGSLGDELTLTSGKIARSAGGDHLNDSIITEYGATTIGINGGLEITGSILSTVTPLVSGSSQISFNGITDKPTLVSGSSQVSFNGISNVPSGIVSGSSQVLNGSGVWSGSAQLPAGTVSGSSQVLFGSISGVPSGLVSGSSQIPYSGLTGTPSGIVSGSSQIVYSGLTGIPSGIVSGSSQVLNGSGIWSGSAQLPAGVVSGSSQVLFGSISGVPSGLVSGSSQVLSGTGIWSGSAQLPVGTVSGSSQVLNGTTIHSGSFFNGITVVSGSSQITFGGLTGVPSGLVSGSSQVSFGGLTGVPSGLVSGSSQVLLSSGIWSGSAQLPAGTVSGSSQVLNGTGIWSGSAQLPAGTVSGSSQISYSGLTGIPSGIVSGSSQITYGSLTGVPSGIVSGSSQVIALLPIGTVSGSSQVLAGTTIHSGSFFNGISVVSGSSQISYGGITGVPSGLVSGSSQISYGSITGVPSGLVSGSSQITLSSTTGFGSYLNQAVLTTSTPTFSTVTATTFTGALTGNASTSTSTSNIGGATWAPSTNILLGQSANNQEWSFDITRNGFTGGYWHVWDSANSTMLKVDAVSGKVSAPYNFVGTLEGNITGTASNITAYTINQSVGTNNSPTFAGLTVNGTVIASQSGFQSATYSAGRNRIWSFGNADAYGLSYFQGSGGYGGSTDMIGFHFGTASVAASKFTFVSDGRFITSGDILPSSNNSYNLGSASLGWANVYTNDLHLSNMNKPEGNDIDGTSGTWTIQEGAENLYIINNRNGKKFKISLEEIL